MGETNRPSCSCCWCCCQGRFADGERSGRGVLSVYEGAATEGGRLVMRMSGCWVEDELQGEGLLETLNSTENEDDEDDDKKEAAVSGTRVRGCFSRGTLEGPAWEQRMEDGRLFWLGSYQGSLAAVARVAVLTGCV